MLIARSITTLLTSVPLFGFDVNFGASKLLASDLLFGLNVVFVYVPRNLNGTASMALTILISKTLYGWSDSPYSSAALIASGLAKIGNAATRKGRCGVVGWSEVDFRHTTHRRKTQNGDSVLSRL